MVPIVRVGTAPHAALVEREMGNAVILALRGRPFNYRLVRELAEITGS
jgi:hypothetical protein